MADKDKKPHVSLTRTIEGRRDPALRHRLHRDAGHGGSVQGTMTLRGVVSIEGRRAAAFDWTGSTEFLFTGDPGRGVPGRMVLTGPEWRDLATGAALRMTAKADAEFTRQGQATHVEFRPAEVLDLAESRL